QATERVSRLNPGHGDPKPRLQASGPATFALLSGRDAASGCSPPPGPGPGAPETFPTMGPSSVARPHSRLAGAALAGRDPQAPREGPEEGLGGAGARQRQMHPSAALFDQS